jgi:DNA-binding GntR family transcriptional regulator
MQPPNRYGSQIARIRKALEAQIDQGLFRPGDKLPSERELSVLFETTRITLKDALLALEAEGRIYCEDRRGWFVSPPRLLYNPQYRTHFHEMVTLQNRQARTRVLSAKSTPASPELCRDLGLPPLSPVIEIRRVRSVDGRVVKYVEHYLIASRFPGILDHDLSQSLTGLYKDTYGYTYGRARFEIYPTAARGMVAESLNLADSSPVLLIKRINYDQNGQLLDCDHEYWRHDAVCVSIDSGAPRDGTTPRPQD